MPSKWIAVLILLCATIGSSRAQEFSSEAWHKGQVVLIDGDTLIGDVKYDMEAQTIQYASNGKILAFSPRKLLAFEIYDNLLETYRVFYVLPYRAVNDYEAPYIFELIYEGPHMSLLRTESIETVLRNAPYMYATYTYEELQYTYYFIDTKANIREFSGKKNDLLRIMRDRAPEIREYLRDQNLKLDRPDHLVKISSYYNSLF